MCLCRAFYSCKMLLYLTLAGSFQGESKESKVRFYRPMKERTRWKSVTQKLFRREKKRQERQESVEDQRLSSLHHFWKKWWAVSQNLWNKITSLLGLYRHPFYVEIVYSISVAEWKNFEIKIDRKSDLRKYHLKCIKELKREKKNLCGETQDFALMGWEVSVWEKIWVISPKKKTKHNIVLKAFCFFSSSSAIPHTIVKRVSGKKNVSAETWILD